MPANPTILFAFPGQGAQYPGLANHEVGPHEHDDPEDGEDGGREDTAKRAELVLGIPFFCRVSHAIASKYFVAGLP